MTRFTVECPKEIARIQKTAKNGAAWDKKRAEYLKSIASDAENALEAANKARHDAMVAAEPQWVTVEGVNVLQSPGSHFLAVPVSGKKTSRHWHVIDLNDRTDIYCQLTRKEVYGWLAKAAIAEA
jgi:hypothetical protein